MSEPSFAELQQQVTGNYIETAANTLFLFDSVIAISQEMNVIWLRKWTTMTWLYAGTRYIAVAMNILPFVPVGGPMSCKAGIYASNILLLIQSLTLALFSALRVYALLDGRYLIAMLVFLLGSLPCATNIYRLTASTVVETQEVCTLITTLSEQINISLSLSTRISVIASDALVLAVTWFKTAQLYLEARRLRMAAPLATMLVRDGTIYFIILLVTNVLEVIAANVETVSTFIVAQSLFEVLPAIIVCRFILNLRQIEPVGSSWASANKSVSLRFVGNLGQSLQFGGGNGDLEDDDTEVHRGDEPPDTAPVLSGSDDTDKR